jgi:hypothetical protein
VLSATAFGPSSVGWWCCDRTQPTGGRPLTHDWRPDVAQPQEPMSASLVTRQTLEALTADERAEQLRRDGDTIRSIAGRPWRVHGPGLLAPVHWLWRLDDADELPKGRIGYRCALGPSLRSMATGAIPLHVMQDLEAYDPRSLPKSLRNYLNALPRRGVRIERVSDPETLASEGYEVMLDWRRRVDGIGPTPSPERHRVRISRAVSDKGWVVVAGFQEDRLVGYATGYVVERAAYLDTNVVATEALRLGVSNGLDQALLEAFREVPGVTEVWAGFHEPQRAGLTTFKVRQGFPVVMVPARHCLPAPLEALIRRARPLTYYHWTGRGLPDRYREGHAAP